jgi:hypothetical protein
VGAWGCGGFENDNALDFVGDLADGAGIDRLGEALAAVAKAPPGVQADASAASTALAAAEVVAGARGQPCAGFPEEATEWLGAHGPAAAGFRDLAMAAVKRIAAGSELKELWDEADPPDRDGWRAAMADLERRLT